MESVTYKVVSRTAVVPVAVHPVVSFPAPRSAPNHLAAGALDHLLHRQSQHGDQQNYRFACLDAAKEC